jgi:hypothetical protein
MIFLSRDTQSSSGPTTYTYHRINIVPKPSITMPHSFRLCGVDASKFGAEYVRPFPRAGGGIRSLPVSTVLTGGRNQRPLTSF